MTAPGFGADTGIFRELDNAQYRAGLGACCSVLDCGAPIVGFLVVHVSRISAPFARRVVHPSDNPEKA